MKFSLVEGQCQFAHASIKCEAKGHFVIVGDEGNMILVCIIN